jgi:hypothetical protein
MCARCCQADGSSGVSESVAWRQREGAVVVSAFPSENARPWHSSIVILRSTPATTGAGQRITVIKRAGGPPAAVGGVCLSNRMLNNLPTHYPPGRGTDALWGSPSSGPFGVSGTFLQVIDFATCCSPLHSAKTPRHCIDPGAVAQSRQPPVWCSCCCCSPTCG